MSKEHHTRAAEAHEEAAKTHRTAAQHHDKGDHAKGLEHSHQAHSQSETAHRHSGEAHKSSQNLGNKWRDRATLLAPLSRGFFFLKTLEEAQRLMAPLRDEISRLRRHVRPGFDALAKLLNVGTRRISAMVYCFGCLAVLGARAHGSSACRRQLPRRP
jgi:hypothetical protein